MKILGKISEREFYQLHGNNLTPAVTIDGDHYAILGEWLSVYTPLQGVYTEIVELPSLLCGTHRRQLFIEEHEYEGPSRRLNGEPVIKTVLGSAGQRIASLDGENGRRIARNRLTTTSWYPLCGITTTKKIAVRRISPRNIRIVIDVRRCAANTLVATQHPRCSSPVGGTPEGNAATAMTAY